MYKFIRVSFAHAYYGNPNVGQGTIDVKEGEGYQTKGFEISPDHQYLTAQPYNLEEKYPMRCDIALKPGFFTRLGNLLKDNPMFRTRPRRVSVLTSRRFSLSQVSTVGFNNDYDDSCYSFKEIPAEEFVPDNRTRRIFDENQILSLDQLVRGKVIIYNGWHSGLAKVVPEKMVILGGYHDQASSPGPRFKGLFLREDGSTWEFWPFLSDCSVVPYEKGYYHNKSYLVDTGESMTEAEIAAAYSKRRNDD